MINMLMMIWTSPLRKCRYV